MAFTSLAHHIDIDWLREAHHRVRKDGAPGVDGLTAQDYAENLEANLQSLLDRAKSGTYRAPPVRRVHISKENGETRPLGIPTFEDKVLQKAVAMVLEAVYEQDFLDCSYGFRPQRSAHQALEEFHKQAMTMGGCWVAEVDLRDFFGTVDREHLKELLGHRVRDGVLMRLISKWLRAGVLEDGSITHPESGTPQGGVISPILANVYLHHVLDEWFEHVVKPHLDGQAFMVRYADDFVLGFASESDARRVMAVLPKRCLRYGLLLHPEKTRLIDFRRPRPPRGDGDDGHSPGTFHLLGFTHYWTKSRKRRWVIKTKTMSKRFTRGLLRIAMWCRAHRHDKVGYQHKMLRKKLMGHYAYYGVSGNWRSVANFYRQVERLWRKWLDRRSQQRHMPWDRFKRLLRHYPLPLPRLPRSTYRRAAKPCS
jgi:group II intron reverse transcriptase/maturase